MAGVEILGRHAEKLFARGGGVVAPPGVIKSWPRPNYVDPITHDWAGTVVVIVVFVLSIAVFTARIWARLVLAKNAGLDDLIISVAMLPLIGMSIAVCLGKSSPASCMDGAYIDSMSNLRLSIACLGPNQTDICNLTSGTLSQPPLLIQTYFVPDGLDN
jgi:hypothetical protein